MRFQPAVFNCPLLATPSMPSMAGSESRRLQDVRLRLWRRSQARFLIIPASGILGAAEVVAARPVLPSCNLRP
eukprot:6388305-Alexandrium_andersonii.AAC.1